MPAHIIIYLFSFLGVWIGSGLAVSSVEKLARLLRVSSFIVSFLVLGLFTSMSELSVGVSSILRNDPEIFVGNLVGASIVLLMLVVPLLAIIGRPIKIVSEFQGFNLPSALIVIALPSILILDGRIGKPDSFMALFLFGLLIASIQSKKSILERLKSLSTRYSISVGKELLKIIFGITIIFISSQFIVEQTLYFSDLLQISPFIISLLVISLGTNIPELSLVLRAVFMKKAQVAFGDYIGSAVFNTFLLGILTLFYGKPILLVNSYLTSIIVLVIGLFLFYIFARTKNSISRIEGFVLLGLYLLFIGSEVLLISR